MDIVEQKLQSLSIHSSDINEHLYTLSKYASECESVFETGVRGCVSSWAFLHGLLHNDQCIKKLFMNDIEDVTSNIHELLVVSENLPITITYQWINNLDLDFHDETYDLTFIDTWHVYGQLKRELSKFAPITNKYIIMHDTTIDEWFGETIRQNLDPFTQSQQSGIPENEITVGLWPAIEEFLQTHHEWILHQRFYNNNGLTILKRIQS